MSLTLVDASSQKLQNVERRQLERCEAVIEDGLTTFYRVGNALLTIRDGKLYREEYSAFDDYCRVRWKMSKTHANRMIQAAEVVTDLTPIGVIPENEAQARALVEVPSDLRPVVMTEAAETAPEGRLTAAHIQSVADRHTGKESERAAQVEAQKEAEAEAERLVRGFMDAPNALPEPDDPAENVSDEKAGLTAVQADEETYMALYKAFSPEWSEGRIAPPVLVDGWLYITLTHRTNGGMDKGELFPTEGRASCARVQPMDWWIDQKRKVIHAPDWQAEVSAGKRDGANLEGLRLIAVNAPKEVTCYYVATGEQRDFWFRKVERKATPAPSSAPPPEPEPEPIPEPQPQPGQVYQAKQRAEEILADAEQSASGCRLNFLEVQALCGEFRRLRGVEARSQADVERLQGLVDVWMQRSRQYEEERDEALRQVEELLNVEAEAMLPDPTAGQGNGIWVKNCDLKLLKQLAARKRPGQEEALTPEQYLSLMIEQRAAMAGIAADGGV